MRAPRPPGEHVVDDAVLERHRALERGDQAPRFAHREVCWVKPGREGCHLGDGAGSAEQGVGVHRGPLAGLVSVERHDHLAALQVGDAGEGVDVPLGELRPGRS